MAGSDRNCDVLRWTTWVIALAALGGLSWLIARTRQEDRSIFDAPESEQVSPLRLELIESGEGPLPLRYRKAKPVSKMQPDAEYPAAGWIAFRLARGQKGKVVFGVHGPNGSLPYRCRTFDAGDIKIATIDHDYASSSYPHELLARGSEHDKSRFLPIEGAFPSFKLAEPRRVLAAPKVQPVDWMGMELFAVRRPELERHNAMDLVGVGAPPGHRIQMTYIQSSFQPSSQIYEFAGPMHRWLPRVPDLEGTDAVEVDVRLINGSRGEPRTTVARTRLILPVHDVDQVPDRARRALTQIASPLKS